MIVDTSALVAVAYDEDGSTEIALALMAEAGVIIAPVFVEFCRVTAGPDNRPSIAAETLLAALRDCQIGVAPFDIRAADAAVAANVHYGSGNEAGGKLNLLDLMVYGAAKVAGLPILCTGRDFAATDALIHPASRVG